MNAYPPSGFHWLIPDVLAGSARPNETELRAMQALNIKRLVCLTAERRPDPDYIARYAIESLWMPIADFGVPDMDQAMAFCKTLSADVPTVLHCRAGRGRTGTMLAAMLIYHGDSATTAIHRTRAANPVWIETQSQLNFLADFETFAAA